MIIQPLRSFTGEIDVADFVDLKLYWNFDDVRSGAIDEVVTCKCRVTGNILSITPTAGSAILKDAEGLYSNAVAASLVITGTMPTVLNTHYAVVASTGKAPASSSLGAGVTFGGLTGLKITNSGFATFNNVTLSSAPALSPAALTNAAKPVANVGYYDFVDVTGTPANPRIERIVANNDFTSAVSNSSGVGTTSAGATLTPGLIGNELGNFASFHATNNSGRIASIMLLLRLNPLTLGDNILASITMAQTRKPYAGWRS